MVLVVGSLPVGPCVSPPAESNKQTQTADGGEDENNRTWWTSVKEDRFWGWLLFCFSLFFFFFFFPARSSARLFYLYPYIYIPILRLVSLSLAVRALVFFIPPSRLYIGCGGNLNVGWRLWFSCSCPVWFLVVSVLSPFFFWFGFPGVGGVRLAWEGKLILREGRHKWDIFYICFTGLLMYRSCYPFSIPFFFLLHFDTCCFTCPLFGFLTSASSYVGYASRADSLNERLFLASSLACPSLLLSALGLTTSLLYDG